jgi:hypothetical protein
VIEEYTDLPAGTIGFRVWGKITRDDSRRASRRSSRAPERCDSLDALGWIVPGELKLFSHDELDEAKA